MPALDSLEVPDFGTLQVVPTGTASLELSGSISFKDPRAVLTPFLHRVHKVACNLPDRTLEVDISRLRYVNSSAIRVLLDWTKWILQEPAEHRYEILFRVDFANSWQNPTLSVMSALAPEVVRVKPRS
ncbi:MAG: hypothetical protein JW751_20985 [Polyangiaceae bacterium]|nr:hypothetical protein [Polyangiaceae bacterium]